MIASPARASACALLLLLAVAAHGAASTRQTQQVTPVEKVTELLKRIETQVADEGKLDAAQYDKYACFCKEQADDKLYAIEKSEKKIEGLNALLEALKAEIAELSSKVQDLVRQISDLEGKIKASVAIRAKERVGYLVKAADMDGAIEALVGAIEALKNSKAEMTDAKLDLVQLRALAGRVLQTLQSSPLTVQPSSAQIAAVTVLLGNRQSPVTYTYHSNDIIATLEGLLVQFKENKKELDEEEFAVNAAFEKDRLNLANEKKFAEKEKAETESLLGIKEEEQATAMADLEAETKDKTADESFLEEITGACEAKAKLFDQRSTTRSGELTAISEAIAALESGVKPNWKANKKLVDLQKGSTGSDAKESRRVNLAPTFLQRGIESTGQRAPLNRALLLIEGVARRLGSPLLTTLSVKARVQIDHFVEVRGLIKDFIQKLQDDAESEATTKSFCDTEMKAATETRDDKQAELEELANEISKTETEIAQLKSEIAVFAEQIGELYKALKEATELRETEKSANAKTLADAEAGSEGVKFAIGVLKDFYENAFLQKGSRYVPPNADREGKTVSDLAPEVFDKTYHGSQDESTGIIGILEVIVSDFERTIETVTADEKAAQEEFEAFEVDTKKSIDAKERSKSEKEAQVVELEDELADLTDKSKDAKKALDIALSELEKLKGMCVEGEETWEERSAKRREEIEALKEALKILDEWQA